MISESIIRIGNAQGFWGDRGFAPAELLRQEMELDYLTLDYLAEVSLSIMAVQKDKDPALGFAKDFLDVVRSIVPIWKEGAKVKIITNAGGLNPESCMQQCLQILHDSGIKKKIGIVKGDNVKEQLIQDPSHQDYQNLEDDRSFSEVADQCVTANAYFGAHGIAEALRQGAELVITGRCADPSLAVGACVAGFGWSWSEVDKIASATVAGHLLECGTQVTGGISTDWLHVPNPAFMGYPIVEMRNDGIFTVTKPLNTGGTVNLHTVKEQLLYELGDPEQYISPDVVVSFLGIQLMQEGKDRVRVSGAIGRAPTLHYKVNATYRDGYRADGMLALYGRDLVRKGVKCGEIILERLRKLGCTYERSCIECIGTGDLVKAGPKPREPLECMLHIAVSDSNLQALEQFCKEIAPLVTSGPQGITGYTSGRPKVRPVFGFWPCLIQKEKVPFQVEVK